MNPEDLELVGFWPRVGASIIDSILMAMIILPILMAFYGEEYWFSESFVQGPVDLLVSYIFPAAAVIAFWVAKQATPGKMAISAKIVDAKTGNPPSTGQFIGRYFAYYLSTFPLGLGLLWVAFDSRKQGWHDKLAGTLVVRPKNRAGNSKTFMDGKY
ncbi:RDD family protein [Methylomonas rosea]|uniref:RDD family protein n=1 Tax=Methylomonas rosea TaxID=2952227 RepID=A0ABT1TUY5_9GAMM|nr:RDD family protein [Methylomonas sp. WSC-7]MCQ8118335.1 RDD family protein [Methylomonas sp. WSC-7]